jgi:hypothetical protein
VLTQLWVMLAWVFFRCDSAAQATEVLAAIFEAEQDADDPDSPYLLIQRQFEDPDDDRCYIETRDEKYCGHFLLRRLDLTPQKLSIELDRPRDNFVSVNFAIEATD